MHGFGNSLQSYRNLAPLLTDCCHVLAFDFPGFGLSSLPTDYDFSNAGQARTALGVVKALDVDRPVYVGHSMGGAIAIHTGVTDPTAAALVLIDPGIFETGVPKATSMAPFPFPRMSAMLFGDRAWRERFLKISFVDPTVVTPAVMDDLMRTPARDDYWPGATAMMSGFVPGNEIELLPRIKIPVLSVFGEADRNHPDALRRKLRDSLPGSQLIVLAGAGHYPHEEKAAEVAEAIKTMLKAWGLAGTGAAN
jgi:pimeloyl-ACP methyl ester carboxylesterase